MTQYKKNFDRWNKQKKFLENNTRKTFYFHEREVWWCALGVNIGFEQDGKNLDYARLVIIIKKYGANACLIVPLTSQPKKGKYYFYCGNLHERKSMAILSQVRFIDQRRLLRKYTVIQKRTFDKLKVAIIRVNFL